MADVITITLNGDAAGAVGAINQTSQALGRLEGATTKTGGVLGSVFGGIGQGVGFAAGLAGINGIAGALSAVGESAVGLNSRLEQAGIGFTSMLGSAEKAEAFLKDLQQFAATTPFEFPDLVTASQRMLAFGFEAKEVRPLLTAVGSAAAAMGSGKGGIDQITRALGQMRAATVVQAGELNQLTEAGVPAFQLLADKMGISTGEVKKLVEQGKIASSVFIEAFQEWANANFGDMMAKQALTFEGAVSTVKDTVQLATAQAFRPLFELISQGAVTLSQFVQSDTFSAWADAVAGTIADVIRQLSDGVRTIRQVFEGDWLPSDEIEPFAKWVGIAATGVRDFARWVADLPAPVKAAAVGFAATVVAAGPLAGILGAAGAAIAAVGAGLAFLVSPLGLVAAGVGLLAAAWVGNWGGIQEKTAFVWQAVKPIFMELLAWLQDQIPKALDWLANTAWPALVTAFETVSTWITTVGIPAFTQLVEWLGPKITAVATWITETGWPALVEAGQAVSEWITGTAIPAITDLVDWLGPKISAVTTWIFETGWPALVTAGEAVWGVVQTVIQFFKDLYVELDKRGVFTDLQTIWGQVVDIGGKVWDILGKIAVALAPVFEWVGKLVAETVLPALVGLFGGVAEKAGAAVSPVNLVAGAIKGLFGIISLQLAILEKFVDLMDRLSRMKMPSLSLPGFGGGGAGQATTLSFGDGGGGRAMQYMAAINAASAEYGVPADVIAAILDTEGSGERSVSPAGARGVMQVMPFHYLPGEDPFDPATSIRQGARVLAQNYQSSGSWNEAAAAYFGYGTDAGGMTTERYRNIFEQNRQRYQTAPPVNAPMTRIPLAGGPGSDPSFWPGFMGETFEQLPGYLQSLETIQQSGAEAFNGVAQAAGTAGATLVTTSTDHMGNVMTIYQDATGVIGATITDATGTIVNQWGAMTTSVTEQTTALATAVPEQTNLMAGGALTSITGLGDGILTTVTDMAGTTIATVTDMQGQVTSQTAQMANGVVLQAGGMQAGVVTGVTQMADGTITTVQDMAGNAVVTVTDMAGNVTNQYVTMGATATGAVQSFATEAGTAFESVQGPADTAKQAMEAIGEVEIGAPDVGGVLDALEDITDAAEDARDAIRDITKAEKGGSKGGSKELAKRHAGGPVGAGIPYLVGRAGAEELFIPRTSGYVLPGSVAPAGRGEAVQITVGSIVVQGSDKDAATLAAEIRTELIKLGRRNGGGILGGMA